MTQNNKSYIIAEAGVNHNGDMKLARELVLQAAAIGADAVKFQTFKTDKIVHPNTPQAEYQKQSNKVNTQHELLSSLELTYENYQELLTLAKTKNIDFLSTPFDIESLNFLLDLGLTTIKISSGDLTFGPLLMKAAQSGCKVFISTGMATIDEIRTALHVLAYGYQNPKTTPSSFEEIINYSSKLDLQAILSEKVTIFHCTSEYPAPFDEINLNVISTLANEFGLKIGYSDHSMGILVPALAIAKGAIAIEKHFTLNNELEGPDHKASLNVQDFFEMIKQIRLTEKILGSFEKRPTPAELKNKPVVRRGLYAACNIAEGEKITSEKLLSLRPESRLTPMSFWDLINKQSSQNIKELEPV